MSSSVKVYLPPSLPGAARGGGSAAAGGADGGDDGDGPWRRKYNHDLMHKFDPDDDEEEEKEEDEEENDGGDRAAAESSPSPTSRGRRGRQNQQAASDVCQVCHRHFASAKALHGHMRSHPQRTWRGVLPPSMRPGRELEVADSLILLSGKGYGAERQKYSCKVCGREFQTRQALGGHRASHKSREGCYARAAGRSMQPFCEEEVCTAESLAPVTGPSTSRMSVGASTSTRTVLQNTAAAVAPRLEQELTSGVTRRRRKRRRRRERIFDLNQPPQSSDSTTGDGSESATR